ncbi:hypothetical protein B0G52_1383 [Cohnella sp. SGD-V74]|nr:hypothetical protein B0G52_1383 [Cohnella sp. SGD-V74]
MTLIISIHASREGCDRHWISSRHLSLNFNPRIPRGMRLAFISSGDAVIYFNPRIPRGMRRARSRSFGAIWRFQSTHPARDATALLQRPSSGRHISIHASREGCDWFSQVQTPDASISIHASREGCDLAPFYKWFYIPISIHASREGCDHLYRGHGAGWIHFNPRIPRGMRPIEVRAADMVKDFNPRIPRGMRLATINERIKHRNFNPRIPRGMRPRRSMSN